MSRNEIIRKLANAIREYSGLINGNSGQVIHAPKPGAVERIRRHAEKLHLNADETVAKIDAFNHYDQLRDWLKTLERTENPHHFNRKAMP